MKQHPGTPPRNHESPTEWKPKIKRVKVMGKGKGRKRGPGLKEKKAVSQKVSPNKEKDKKAKEKFLRGSKKLSKKEALKATKEVKEKIEAQIFNFAGRARCIHGARFAEKARRDHRHPNKGFAAEGVMQWIIRHVSSLVNVVVGLRHVFSLCQLCRGPQPHNDNSARGVLDSPAYGGQNVFPAQRPDRENTKRK